MVSEVRPILVPRSYVSFGHVVGETEALVSAVTGCPKIPDSHSLIRDAHSFLISQWQNPMFSLRPGLLVSGAKKKKTRSSGNEDEVRPKLFALRYSTWYDGPSHDFTISRRQFRSAILDFFIFPWRQKTTKTVSEIIKTLKRMLKWSKKYNVTVSYNKKVKTGNARLSKYVVYNNMTSKIEMMGKVTKFGGLVLWNKRVTCNWFKQIVKPGLVFERFYGLSWDSAQA